jgi:hypothetical protein
MPNPLTLSDLGIRPFTAEGNYQVDVPLHMLKASIDRLVQERASSALDLLPDFQRGHVWTEAQQVAFVEYIVRGGRAPMLYFNCVGWMHDYRGPFVIVDGLQRLTAMLKFWDDGLRVFANSPEGDDAAGYLRSELDPIIFKRINVRLCVNALETRLEVLNWYLDMNAGGTPHTNAELQRVRQMIVSEIDSGNAPEDNDGG